MEDAIPADMQEGFRLIRHHTVTPLAVGEVFNSVQDCHTLITEQLIDYIRMTIVHGGGITPLLKLAHLAAHYNVRTGFQIGRASCRERVFSTCRSRWSANN